jgi:7-carboxy-7-deazaguanine synthase
MTDRAEVEALLPEKRGDTLLVSEIYPCIQGESTFAGTPFVLVRLARCNLRCTWCDSAFSFKGGTRWTIPSVLSEVRGHLLPHVLVTGGEPLLQPSVHELMRKLCDEEYTVLLETGGSIDVAPVDPRVRKILDVKCPGSGECEANHWPNVAKLSMLDEVKFVLAGREDYEWAREVVRREGLATRCGAILFSPVFGDTELPRKIAAWILEDKLPVRLQLQLHKVIWDPKERRR